MTGAALLAKTIVYSVAWNLPSERSKADWPPPGLSSTPIGDQGAPAEPSPKATGVSANEPERSEATTRGINPTTNREPPIIAPRP
jgi:hypothetical protein